MASHAKDSDMAVEGSVRRHGQVVWGKVGHYPWWPAQVIAIQHNAIPEAGLPDNIHDQWQAEVQNLLNDGVTTTKNEWPYVVRFYGEKDVSWDFLTDRVTKAWDDASIKRKAAEQMRKYESSSDRGDMISLKKLKRAIKDANSVNAFHKGEYVKNKTGFDVLDYPLPGVPGQATPAKGMNKDKKQKKKKKKKTGAKEREDRKLTAIENTLAASEKLERELKLLRLVASNPPVETADVDKHLKFLKCIRTSHLWLTYNSKMRKNLFDALLFPKTKAYYGSAMVSSSVPAAAGTTPPKTNAEAEAEAEVEGAVEEEEAIGAGSDSPIGQQNVLGKRPVEAEGEDRAKEEPPNKKQKKKKKKTLVDKMRQQSNKYLFEENEEEVEKEEEEEEPIDFNLGLLPPVTMHDDRDQDGGVDGKPSTSSVPLGFNFAHGDDMGLDLSEADVNVNVKLARQGQSQSQGQATQNNKSSAGTTKVVESLNTVVIQLMEGSRAKVPSESDLKAFGGNFGALMRIERGAMVGKNEDECKLVFYEAESASKCAKNAIQFGLCGLKSESIRVGMVEEGFLPPQKEAPKKKSGSQPVLDKLQRSGSGGTGGSPTVTASSGGGGGMGGVVPSAAAAAGVQTATYKPSDVPKPRPIFRERPNMLANHNHNHSRQLEEKKKKKQLSFCLDQNEVKHVETKRDIQGSTCEQLALLLEDKIEDKRLLENLYALGKSNVLGKQSLQLSELMLQLVKTLK